ncbi:DUF5133 domain-containing protein [Streptomyces sp. ME02-8801-2C]|uniref:DUF5133 domain-containing protein n=1 Tax=Streptomyces sp. ME02-8801-2C TaxID=3028680 RepID=UPI0029A843FF|nr:DUF5133 domain-containing protein [Streptomyces sp. ME02-8801-2C]MDX3458186.1 DUF5133 domain-containing protein [Streptomyces sp. ME02-8801-2C]
MLMAHPTVLADLLERYEILRARHDQENSAQSLQRLNDVSYTLCVATGTRDIAAALKAARHRVLGARSKSDRDRVDHTIKADL